MNEILSTSFVLICLFCFVISQIIKSFLKIKLKSKASSPYAKEVLFPSIPLVVGAIASCLLNEWNSESIIIGTVAGLLSGYIFAAVKATIKKKTDDGTLEDLNDNK